MKKILEDREGQAIWVLYVLIAIAIDPYLIKNNKQSISRGFWELVVGNRFVGPMVVGAWCALTWHLVIDNPLLARKHNDK